VSSEGRRRTEFLRQHEKGKKKKGPHGDLLTEKKDAKHSHDRGGQRKTGERLGRKPARSLRKEKKEGKGMNTEEKEGKKDYVHSLEGKKKGAALREKKPVPSEEKKGKNPHRHKKKGWHRKPKWVSRFRPQKKRHDVIKKGEGPAL